MEGVGTLVVVVSYLISLRVPQFQFTVLVENLYFRLDSGPQKTHKGSVEAPSTSFPSYLPSANRPEQSSFLKVWVSTVRGVSEFLGGP